MRIISGIYKNRKLFTPKGLETRPTSERLREALFNICQHQIADALFLDLFAGSGAMGLEALSRGAAHATFVETNTTSIKRNIELLQVQNQTTALSGDVFYHLDRMIKSKQQFHIIFADPPYETSLKLKNKTQFLSDHVLECVNSSPLLFPGGMLFIEESSDWQPATNLLSLKLLSSRRMGKSSLHEFQSLS